MAYRAFAAFSCDVLAAPTDYACLQLDFDTDIVRVSVLLVRISDTKNVVGIWGVELHIVFRTLGLRFHFIVFVTAANDAKHVMRFSRTRKPWFNGCKISLMISGDVGRCENRDYFMSDRFHKDVIK